MDSSLSREYRLYATESVTIKNITERMDRNNYNELVLIQITNTN